MSTIRTRNQALVKPPLLSFDNAKTLLFIYVVLTRVIKIQRHLRARGTVASVRELYTWVAQHIISLFMRIPSMAAKVETEMNKAKLDIENQLVPKGADVVRHLSLPAKGKSLEWILSQMEVMDGELPGHFNWRNGKISGAVYHGGDESENVIVQAYQRYCVSNPLHPSIFPAVRKMEAEIVAMCLKLYNNPDGAGTMTSGGTESIIMAVKTYRDWARAVKGITEPEMVIPSTAHAAFDKGAAYLKIKIHTIPVDPVTRRVDIKRVKRAINANTIMLVGSAINFPDGNQDDITALGKLASYYKIGLHVDCCLGSFIMPYLARAGLADGEDGKYKLLPFDFRVPGVTSISCDTHKASLESFRTWAWTHILPGTSVIMYRDAALRKHQYYVNPHWSGGVYASPSLSGSRPGALIAGTWAVMHYIGDEGYLESCRSIVSTTRTIANAISESIPELYVLGSPPASVVAFASKHPKVNILEVGDAMAQRGWHLNALSPPAVHIACTRLTVSMVDTFIADLKDAVNQAKTTPSGKGTMVALYGAHPFSLDFSSLFPFFLSNLSRPLITSCRVNLSSRLASRLVDQKILDHPGWESPCPKAFPHSMVALVPLRIFDMSMRGHVLYLGCSFLIVITIRTPCASCDELVSPRLRIHVRMVLRLHTMALLYRYTFADSSALDTCAYAGSSYRVFLSIPFRSIYKEFGTDILTSCSQGLANPVLLVRRWWDSLLRPSWIRYIRLEV
ncbi:Sphingosine-1-phosphate lyase [Termitomyces sp. J132]|nr:Sphingosine-1-phosphate lyase [Termitomyces sp. J132]